MAFLTKNLWHDNDSIMANSEITIEKELELLNVKLNIPSLFSCRSQFPKGEVTESQNIASVGAIIQIKQVLNYVYLSLH